MILHRRARNMARWALALFFIAAGTLHFVRTDFYVPIVPPYFPYPRELVYISGFFEILGGAAVLVPRLRRLAGYGLIALLFAVFPANVHMALAPSPVAGFTVPPLLLWLRLPLQALFIAWVYWATKEDG